MSVQTIGRGAVLQDRAALVVSSQLANNAGWIPQRQDVDRQIFGDHRTRSHNGVVANRDARQHNQTAAQPNVIADRDWLSCFPFGAARFRIERMGGRGASVACFVCNVSENTETA